MEQELGEREQRIKWPSVGGKGKDSKAGHGKRVIEVLVINDEVLVIDDPMGCKNISSRWPWGLDSKLSLVTFSTYTISNEPSSGGDSFW